MWKYSGADGRNGRGGYNHFATTKPRSYYALPPDRDDNITEGMKRPALQTLKAPYANPADWTAVQPRGLTPVASYNWTSRKSPTIIVPGCPPIWQNTPTPFKILRDSGRSFADQNRFRMPRYPLLPLFIAIEHMQPSFDYAALDIVTDRNNLRKLLRWIEGNPREDFRIDLQLCGENTVVLGRWVSKPVEMNPQRLGFGLNFEKYTTRLLPGCEESTGHHRIITYDFGGLNMLVRFEVDACSLNGPIVPGRHDHSPSDDDLAVAMAEMSLLSQPTEDSSATGSKDNDPDDGPEICVIPAGKFVPQSTLVELSTKSLKYIDPNHSNTYRGRGRGGSSYSSRATEVPTPDWDLYFPQLYLSGTPHHKFAVHERGQFRRVYERTLRDDELKQHLKKQQPSFNKLRVVLGRIIDIVKEKGKDARLSLVYSFEDKRMELCERVSSKGCLPKVWLQKFEPIPSHTDAEEPGGNGDSADRT